MENKQIAVFSFLDGEKLCLVISSKHPINPFSKGTIYTILFYIFPPKFNDHMLFCSTYGLTRSFMFKIFEMAMKNATN